MTDAQREAYLQAADRIERGLDPKAEHATRALLLLARILLEMIPSTNK